MYISRYVCVICFVLLIPQVVPDDRKLKLLQQFILRTTNEAIEKSVTLISSGLAGIFNELAEQVDKPLQQILVLPNVFYAKNVHESHECYERYNEKLLDLVSTSRMSLMSCKNSIMDVYSNFTKNVNGIELHYQANIVEMVEDYILCDRLECESEILRRIETAGKLSRGKIKQTVDEADFKMGMYLFYSKDCNVKDLLGKTQDTYKKVLECIEDELLY